MSTIYPKATAPTTEEVAADANARADRWMRRCVSARDEARALSAELESLRESIRNGVDK